jgi:uncharacterized membrane protein (UPF0136 family)
MGYAKAKSSSSLIAGFATGIAALIAAFLYQHHPRVSLGLGVVLAIAVSAIFASRYKKTGNPMPAIPMIASSIIVGIIQVAVFVMKH